MIFKNLQQSAHALTAGQNRGGQAAVNRVMSAVVLGSAVWFSLGLSAQAENESGDQTGSMSTHCSDFIEAYVDVQLIADGSISQTQSLAPSIRYYTEGFRFGHDLAPKKQSGKSRSLSPADSMRLIAAYCQHNPNADALKVMQVLSTSAR